MRDTNSPKQTPLTPESFDTLLNSDTAGEDFVSLLDDTFNQVQTHFTKSLQHTSPITPLNLVPESTEVFHSSRLIVPPQPSKKAASPTASQDTSSPASTTKPTQTIPTKQGHVTKDAPKTTPKTPVHRHKDALPKKPTAPSKPTPITPTKKTTAATKPANLTQKPEPTDTMPDLKQSSSDIEHRFKRRQQKLQDLLDQKGKLT